MSDPIYREWKPGRFEKLLPASIDEFDQEHRTKRLERFADNVVAGADRDICRQFVLSEEEFRSGCRLAGKEPGDGWLVRPTSVPVASTVRVRTQITEQSTLATELTLAGDDLPW